MATKTKATVKKRTGKPPREKKPKQQFLPGLAPPSVPAIDQAADTYYETMMQRVELSKEEDTAKDNLIDKMKEYSLDRYETPQGLIVSVTATSNVKCKRKKQAPEPSENGEAPAE